MRTGIIKPQVENQMQPFEKEKMESLRIRPKNRGPETRKVLQLQHLSDSLLNPILVEFYATCVFTS